MSILDPIALLSIFVILALLAYIFILRKIGSKKVSVEHITKERARAKESPMKISQKSTEEEKLSHRTTQRNPSSRPESCTHKFGYLGTLPKNSKIPDSCLGCSLILKCLTEGRHGN
jgi:hypothetical protein